MDSRESHAIRWRLIATATIGLAFVLGSVADAAPVPPFDRVPDGTWLGSLVYNAQVSFPSDVQSTATAFGNFDFVVAGGLVSAGTMQFSATGFGAGDGVATIDIEGVGGVEGDASQPVLRADSVHMTGTAVSQGFEVPIDFTFSGADTSPIPLEIYTVTCELVTGDFTQPIAATIAAAGGTGSLFGHWVALRGDDPASAGTFNALDQLIADAETIVNSAKASGTIDSFALLATLDAAEQLAASTSINIECRNIQPDFASTFSLSISMLIADLIGAVVAAPGSVSLTTLQDVVAAGIRTGVLSADAASGSDAESFSIQLEAEFAIRLEAGLGPPVNTADVTQIMLTALTMGWTATADKAAAAL